MPRPIAKVIVSLDFGYGDCVSAAVDIAETDVLRQIDICDEPLTAAMVGGHTRTSARTVYAQRRYLADIIANQICRVLGQRDTHNGYPVKRT